MNQFLYTWSTNAQYFEALGVLASLSKLFSTSNTPYLDYRLAENVFCKFYKAINNARACTSYDATMSNLGIGIKTFILGKEGHSFEKVAEFNRLKPQLDGLKGVELALKIAEFRNDRISLADNIYATTERIYHIVSRDKECLRVFNVPFDEIDVNSIKVTRDDVTSIAFSDGFNEYTFNRSKSVLLKKFSLPIKNVIEVPVDLIDDPLENLLNMFGARGYTSDNDEERTKKDDYVILPLYSVRDQEVSPKSGLNQWNAEGRPRHPDEVYIPIPKAIHHCLPDFFPSRDESFILLLPNKNKLEVKVCQEGAKALMSKQNKDLGRWLLRDVLKKKEYEIVTMEDLNRFGIDSIRIVNEHRSDENGMKIYSISFTSGEYESYEDFINERQCK